MRRLQFWPKCVSRTPFGRPVEPEVYGCIAIESGAGSKASNGPGSRKRAEVARRRSPIDETPAGHRGASAGSTKTSFAPASSTMYRTASAASLMLIGTGTTPARIAPRTSRRTRGRLSERMAMRSPGARPARAGRARRRCRESSSSRKLTGCGPAASRRSTIAVRSEVACSASSSPDYPDSLAIRHGIVITRLRDDCAVASRVF